MTVALDYIHALGEELSEYGQVTTTGDGATDTLVVGALANSELTTTELARYYALIETGASAGQVATIKKGGLARASGSITVGDPYTAAILSGVSASLYRLFPPLREGTKIGLLEIANQALRMLWVERTIALTGVTGQYRYSIDRSLYPWLTDRTRVIQVNYPTTTAGAVTVPLDADAWDWEQNADTLELIFPSAPFATGQTVNVKTYAPANSYLKLHATARATVVAGAVTAIAVVLPGSYSAVPTVALSGGGGSGATATATLSAGGVASVSVGAGGSGYTSPPVVSFTRDAADTGWANQTSQLAGLRGIADEALSDVLDVKTVGAALGYRALAAQEAPGADVAEWIHKAEAWEADARQLEHFGRPSNARTNVAVLRPVTVGGARARWRG